MKIRELPSPIMARALINQVQQGNPPDREIDIIELARNKGFDWGSSHEGLEYWNAIRNGDFNAIPGMISPYYPESSSYYDDDQIIK